MAAATDPSADPVPDRGARVELYWLPLGADDATHCVRLNGRIFEAIAAHRQGRSAVELYHSALQVYLGGDRFAIEMAPAWGPAAQGGSVCEGPVGLRWLGGSRLFRYQVRCRRGGTIPDIAHAAGGPQYVTTSEARARRLLELVPRFPCATWGRDELTTGEMWNSNSLTSWLLAGSGHAVHGYRPPGHGRAPGWRAGLVVAGRGGPAMLPVTRGAARGARSAGE